MRDQNPDTITASEVAEFMFCAKAWQLKREGHEPDSPYLEPGVAFHQKHGQRLSLANQLRWVAWGIFGLALLLLIFLLWNLR